jgi:hypothetical protein
MIGTNRFFQTNYNPSERNSFSYRVGADLYADNKNTFGIFIRGFNLTSDEHTVNTTQQIKASTGAVLSTFSTFNNAAIKRDNIAANVNWKHNFDTTGKDLNIDFDYSTFQLRNNNDIITQAITSSYLNQSVNNPVKFGVLKLDYSHPFNKNTKLEMGGKTSLAIIDNYLVFKKSNVVDPSEVRILSIRKTSMQYMPVSRKKWTTGNSLPVYAQNKPSPKEKVYRLMY